MCIRVSCKIAKIRESFRKNKFVSSIMPNLEEMIKKRQEVVVFGSLLKFFNNAVVYSQKKH